jgi:lipopolysaccharide export system protein LptA
MLQSMHFRENIVIKINVLIVMMGLFLSSMVFALASDNQQPLQLSSDAAACHREGVDSVCIYTGKVVFDQGSTHLRAPEITIYKVGAQIEKLIARGKRASYSTILDQNHKAVDALADEITFYVHKDVLVLNGDGEVTEDGNKFSGPYVEYQLKGK